MGTPEDENYVIARRRAALPASGGYLRASPAGYLRARPVLDAWLVPPHTAALSTVSTKRANVMT
jgi:hypothetical protein